MQHTAQAPGPDITVKSRESSAWKPGEESTGQREEGSGGRSQERREAWSETAIAGLRARQQEPRSGLSGPSSVFLSERVSGHGPFLLLLGGGPGSRTAGGSAQSLSPSVALDPSSQVRTEVVTFPHCSHWGCSARASRPGAPLSGAQALPSWRCPEWAKPLPQQGLELGLVMGTSYFSKTAVPPC